MVPRGHGQAPSPAWLLRSGPNQQQLACHASAVRRAALKVHDTSHTSRQFDVTRHSITLTTQCSLDRWPRFQQQAESWGGPVSVAVYIPAPKNTAAADVCIDILQLYAANYAAQHPEQQLWVSALFAGHHAREGASVLKATGFQAQPGTPFNTETDIDSSSIAYEHLYPINALRNLALLHASTPLVLPVDADFIFSHGLEQQLHAPGPTYSLQSGTTTAAAASKQISSGTSRVVAALASATNTAAVPDAAGTGPSLAQQLLLNQHQQPNKPLALLLPAFQLVPQQQQQQQIRAADQFGEAVISDARRLDVPKTKAELLHALEAGSAKPFDCGVFAPKQQPLDLEAWCTATRPLEVPYVDLFEVHGGLAVKQLPPYSEDFRGYGLNKQQHAWHAAALGFRFLALPDAFMVTAPHKRSSSWRPVPGTAADSAHLQRISAVYERFKQQLAEQGLKPQ